eukprot:g1540.t1
MRRGKRTRAVIRALNDELVDEDVNGYGRDAKRKNRRKSNGQTKAVAAAPLGRSLFDRLKECACTRSTTVHFNIPKDMIKRFTKQSSSKRRTKKEQGKIKKKTTTVKKKKHVPKFRKIRTNINLLPRPMIKDFDPTELCCDCVEACTVENCINARLKIECTRKTCAFCAAGTCANTRFSKKIWKKVLPFDTGDECRGWGLKIRDTARAGDFIIEYVGELIDQQMLTHRMWGYHREKQKNGQKMNFYMLSVNADCVIDATKTANCSRFLNHSCNPSCEVQKWQVGNAFKIGIFALRDLEPGEELTIDYQAETIASDSWECRCGEPNCRGTISAASDVATDLPRTSVLQKKRRKKRSHKTNSGLALDLLGGADDAEIKSIVDSRDAQGGAKARRIIRAANRASWRSQKSADISSLMRLWNPLNHIQIIEWGQKRSLFVGVGERWRMRHPKVVRRGERRGPRCALHVGSKVSVYFAEESIWRSGHISEIDSTRKVHSVRFDNGEVRKYDSFLTTVEWTTEDTSRLQKRNSSTESPALASTPDFTRPTDKTVCPCDVGHAALSMLSSKARSCDRCQGSIAASAPCCRCFFCDWNCCADCFPPTSLLRKEDDRSEFEQKRCGVLKGENQLLRDARVGLFPAMAMRRKQALRWLQDWKERAASIEVQRASKRPTGSRTRQKRSLGSDRTVLRERLCEWVSKRLKDGNSTETQQGATDLNDHRCARCRGTGVLLCCDGCPLSIHLTCAGLFSVPKGKWYCKGCKERGKRSGSRV